MKIPAPFLSALFPVSISKADPLVIHDKFGNYFFDLYNSASIEGAPGDIRTAIAKAVVLSINEMWGDVKETSEEDRQKFMTENIAPLLRAGYNQALCDIMLWCHSTKELNILDLYAKLTELQNNRREMISETIKKEFN